MDLGRILDGTPEPPSIVPALDFFTSGILQPADTNSDRDYVLPVPMTPFQKQLTDDVVSLHYSDILRFFESGSLENLVLQDSLENLYANTQLVATHPYLLVQHYLPPNLLLKDVPNKLSRSSGKFSVLVDLIDLIRDKKIDVALISRAGKSFDLIEALLLGRMINYKRYSGTYLRQSNKTYKKYSTIHLFPSSQLDSTYIGSERFDLVIAFDLSFNPTDSHIQAVRTQSRPPDSPPAPIIRLIPYYSAEHIVYKFRDLKNENETLYMKRVVAAIVVLRGRAGAVPVDLRPYYSLGLKFLLPWISDPIKSQWPLPPIPEIDIYSAQDVEKSLLTEVNVDLKQPIDPEGYPTIYGMSTSTSSSSNSNNNNNNNSTNNHNNNNNNSNNNNNNHSNGHGHGSNSNLPHGDYPYSLANGTPNQLPVSVLRYQSDHDMSHKNIHRYMGEEGEDEDDFYQAKRFKREKYSPTAPETAFSFLAPPGGGLNNQQTDKQILTHKILRRLDMAIRDLSLKESELNSLRALASSRQTLYEDALDESGTLVIKINTLTEKLRIHERKSDRHDAEVEKLKQTISNQSAELKEARKMLADGAPELSKLEDQRAQIADLEGQVKRANERAELRTTENDYMRAEYQKASSAATDALEEVKTLKTENGVLTDRAKNVSIELRKLTFDEERQARDKKIHELEIKIGNMEEHMKKLIENERLQPTRSRYGMRNATGSRRTNSPSVNSGGRRGSPSTN